MKEFFAAEARVSDAVVRPDWRSHGIAAERRSDSAPQAPSGRVAVYDSLTSSPRIEDVSASDSREFIERLATRTYETARDQGGHVPYTVIREVVENLIHARFTEVVVTVLDGGDTISLSDQGPGIPDKDRAFLPGFSTATSTMKQVIRGVGSGLPIVKECMGFSDGTVAVEDNLGRGTVVTLRLQPALRTAEERHSDPELPARPRLSVRQKQVLSLVMEIGSVGPSAVSAELKVALSTAYRDLEVLEGAGLVRAAGSGKRALTEEGVAFLDELLKP